MRVVSPLRILLIGAALSGPTREAAALQAQEQVFHYSTMTSSFDGLLPIGQRFTIKGAVPAEVEGARVESFGFHGFPPPALRRTEAGSTEFCGALKDARKQAQKTVLYSAFGWERTTEGAAEYTVNHPRLYYGRNYTFVFTFFRKVDKPALRALLADGLRATIDVRADFDRLMQKGLSGESLQAGLDEVVTRLRQGERGCGPLIVTRTPGELERFWQLTREAMAATIALLATRRDQEAILQARDSFPELRNALVSLPQEVREQPDIKLDIDVAVKAAERKDWIQAGKALGRVLRTSDSLKTAGALSAAVVTKAVGGLSDVMPVVASLRSAQQTLAALPDTTPESVAAKLAEGFPLADLDEVLSATTVLPYSETMKAALPFLISIDGGLSYVARFRQLVPIVGVNAKLNRVDFDDPLDHRAEFSILVGMGISSPDDLDPDYEGIFSSSSRSLWVGAGVRPGFAPLLRGHVGLLLFRQRDENPLVKDLHTRASLTVGVSANWDVLDFAATLVRGRPTLGAGGL